MLIIDAHLDIAWNALQWERDYLQSVYTIRTQEWRMQGATRGRNTVALPEMRKARVAISFATLLARSTGTPSPRVDYRSPFQAHAIARGQLAYYQALEQSGYLNILRTRQDLDDHMTRWFAWDEDTDGRNAVGLAPALGVILSMEGADPIVSPDHLESWADQGLRILGLTHYGLGRYAGGTATERGLTAEGRTLLAEMERLGIALDLTHCSDQAFWEALDTYSGQVIASHSNSRALAPHQRQLDDDQIRAVIERQGVIGIALSCWLLTPGYQEGDSTQGTSLDAVIEHVERVCEIAGNADHVGIGSDLDGGFGSESTPHDLDTILDLQKIPERLKSRGFADADIAKIMHGNWQRDLAGILP